MPTHGSLTKAGKVRNQTPKLTPIKKKNIGPKRKNRQDYRKLISENQNSYGQRRRGRRRRQ
jgi:small subunit ribosomal protein S30e